MLNGALENYSDVLAERETMISVESFEEWERYKADKAEAPRPDDEVPAETTAPVLTRQKPAKETPVPPATTDATPVLSELTAGTQLPSIEGMGSREAKTVLAQWAETHYGHKLDRRPGLDEGIAACQLLVDNASQAAAG